MAYSSISDAIIYGNLEDVTRFIPQEETLDVIDDYGYSPLIQTAICQTLDKAQALIKAGADVNFPDLTGRTALHWAVDNADFPLCELLLKNHANPNAFTIAGQPVLATPLLRGQRTLNELLYQYRANLYFAQDFVNAKVLGHRYDLLGRVDIVDNTDTLIEVDYEGFYLESTIAIILNSLTRFKNNFGARHLRRWFMIIKRVIQAFKGSAELIKYQNYTIDIAKHANKINSLLSNNPLILPIACEGHAITFVQYGKLLVRCDRGQYGREHGSVIIYRMNKPQAWTPEFIKSILYKYQSREFIDDGIVDFLQLTPLMTLPLSLQITGNCSWANVEAAIPATMFLLMLTANKKDLANTWQDCETAALYFYEEWREWDKSTALYDCIESFNDASSPRQATKAALLGSILFQYCDYHNVKDLDKAEKILQILKRPQFRYVLENYVQTFCTDERLKEGKNFGNILDHFGIDIQKFL